MLDDIVSRLLFFPDWLATELFIVCLLFCLKHERRPRFLARFIPCAVVYNVAPFLIPDFYNNAYLTVGWFSFHDLICVVLIAGMIFLCFRMRLINSVFYTSMAYALVNIVTGMYSLTMRNLSDSVSTVSFSGLVVGVVWFALFTGIFYLLFMRGLNADFSGRRDTLIVSAMCLVTFLVSYVFDLWLHSASHDNVGTDVYTIIVNVLMVLMQCGYCVIVGRRREREILAELLDRESETLAASREAAEAINIKAHDLKHLAAAGDAEADEVVDVYDVLVNSGNGVLDVILTQKNLTCRDEGIAFRVIADGAALSFMEPADMYTLFGNILDNAIEEQDRLPEGERAVSLNVSRGDGFVRIHEDNRCDTALTFRGGLPETTKPGPGHGYGTRSIKATAKKYGGAVEMSCSDGIFDLDVLIPLRDRSPGPAGQSVPAERGREGR